MKGFRFYLEYPNKKEKNKGTRKNPGNHEGNVVAVYEDTWRWTPSGNDHIYVADAIAAAFFDTPNCGVATTSVSYNHISEKCKWISEKQAREIHPALFEVLDYDPDILPCD